MNYSTECDVEFEATGGQWIVAWYSTVTLYLTQSLTTYMLNAVCECTHVCVCVCVSARMCVCVYSFILCGFHVHTYIHDLAVWSPATLLDHL